MDFTQVIWPKAKGIAQGKFVSLNIYVTTASKKVKWTEHLGSNLLEKKWDNLKKDEFSTEERGGRFGSLKYRSSIHRKENSLGK